MIPQRGQGIRWVISRQWDCMWWWSLYLWNKRLILSAEDFSHFGRSVRLNRRVVFSWFFFISLVMVAPGLLSPFLFYALVDIVICFFETDLSLLICLSLIKVKWKEVITIKVYVICAKLWKLLKWMILLGWKEINLFLTVGKDFNGSMLDEKTITHEKVLSWGNGLRTKI